MTLSFGKKVLFALVSTLLVLVLLEGVLVVLGIGSPKVEDEDPYVGFSRRLPLFEETQNEEGGLIRQTASNRLRLFNSQQFRAQKPTESYRVFCLGGSTTYGRPYDDATSFCGWLRSYLAEIFPDGEFEVINAGGISYASYRVSLLMEELATYEPDLFILYTGHNEFLEERTYEKVLQVPERVRDLRVWVSRSRMGRLMEGVLQGDGEGKAAKTGTKTLLEAEVKTLLDDSVGPDAYHRDDQHRESVVHHFRFNLERIARQAKASGADLLLVKPAANLRHSSPFKSEPTEGLTDDQRLEVENLRARGRNAAEGQRYPDALEHFDAALALDPRNAHLLYERGTVLWSLERYPEAKVAFQAALEEDVCPLRALPSMGHHIEEVARVESLPWVDFLGFVESESPHGVPGNELFLDHVHPTIEAHRRLSLDIVETMAQEGWLTVPPTFDEETKRKVAEQVVGNLDPRVHGLALMKLSKVLGWAGQLEEAHALARRAVDQAPQSPEARYQLGLCAQLLGRTEEAVEQYRVAVNLAPDALLPHGNLAAALEKLGEHKASVVHYRRAWELEGRGEGSRKQFLVEALVRVAGIEKENGAAEDALVLLQEAASLAPEQDSLAEPLGIALLQVGRVREAVPHLERATENNPRNPSTLFSLAEAYRYEGQVARAMDLHRQLLDQDPEFSQSRHLLASLLEQSGEGKAAEQLLQEAVEKGWGIAATHHTVWGSLLFRRGDHEAAARHFSLALQEIPNLGEAALNLAWLQATSRDPRVRNGASAISWSKKARSLLGDSSSSLDVWAASLASVGRFREAMAAAGRARTLAAQEGNAAMVQLQSERLALYAQGEALRDGPPD